MTSEHQPDAWQIPAAPMSTEQAVMVGRHIKAALMHLSQAEDLAVAVGVDLDVVSQDAPGYPLANLIRAARDATEDLDAWAINNAAAAGATRAAYRGTQHWCHRPGGVLPTVEHERAAAALADQRDARSPGGE